MDLNTSRKIIQEDLDALYEESEITQMTEMLLEWATGLDRSQQIAQPRKKLSPEQQQLLHEAVTRLIAFEPIQYILGYTWFAGMKFKTGPDVLIPRPETEELVEWILKENAALSGEVLDIGTGSGCIPVALKKRRPDWTVRAIDFSAPALAIASENAQENEVVVDFRTLDLKKEEEWSALGSFDLIVSNPPYIPWSDYDTLPANVRENEPTEALFVSDEDPLIFYRLIGLFGKQHLNEGGRIYVEINETLGDEVAFLFRSQGYSSVELRQDLQGKPRMMRIQP